MREITHVHLVNHLIGSRMQSGSTVVLPAFGVCGAQIDDSTSISIHPNGLGKDARRLALSEVECIELATQITFYI